MTIQKITHIPGKLLSVSKTNAETVQNLYTKNERVILSGTSSFGSFHFVFVGALNVGSIGLSHFPDLSTNLKVQEILTVFKEHKVIQGQELGWFEMGSTVLILIENDVLSHLNSIVPGQKLQLGNKLN